MRISVLVPSYRRPVDLERCLGALLAQSRLADQILVVARLGDDETFNVINRWKTRLSLEAWKSRLQAW